MRIENLAGQHVYQLHKLVGKTAGVILGAEQVDKELTDCCRALGRPILPFDRKALEDGSYMDAYCRFYDEL